MKRVLFTLAAALGFLATVPPLLSGPAVAQSNYPNRPVTMLVPAAAGGPSDTIARQVAEAMSADLGQRAADVTALFDWLKGKGGGASFGTAGVGSVSDLCGRLLTDATGVKLTVVPYKGTGPAMNDLVGGQTDVMGDQTTNNANQIEAGQIKPYAVTTRERIKLLPNVPTLAESGLKGFDLSAWHAIWAPKGTPEPIRQKLAGSLQKALADPKVIERFAALGTTPVSADMATPAALDERLQSETARWNKLLAGASVN